MHTFTVRVLVVLCKQILGSVADDSGLSREFCCTSAGAGSL